MPLRRIIYNVSAMMIKGLALLCCSPDSTAACFLSMMNWTRQHFDN